MARPALAAACWLLAAGTAAAACADDACCQLNGECTAGSCHCHAGWRGPDCGLLDLLPSADADSPGLAYGAPPSSSGSGGLSSWGGSIVADPDTSSLYHLFAAEMTLGCGLNSWYPNSAIVRATSSSPLGPFVRREEVLGAFSHEPVVLTLPNSEGYVLYKCENYEFWIKNEKSCIKITQNEELCITITAQKRGMLYF